MTHQQPLDVDYATDRYATDRYMKTCAANRAAPAALPVRPVPGSNEDFARWYYDDEPLPTSTKEVPF